MTDNIQRVKPFSSYFSAHQGPLSAFDNVRSALMMTNYPIAIYTNWYSEWNTGADVLPIGKNVVSAHCYVIEGWKVINGTTMFQVEAWLGRKLFMPPETFNNAISQLGCGTAVLSTIQIDILRKKTIIEWCSDIIQNIFLLFKQALTPEVTKQIVNQETKLDKLMIDNKIPPTTNFNIPPNTPQAPISLVLPKSPLH